MAGGDEVRQARKASEENSSHAREGEPLRSRRDNSTRGQQHGMWARLRSLGFQQAPDTNANRSVHFQQVTLAVLCGERILGELCLTPAKRDQGSVSLLCSGQWTDPQ